MINAEAHANKKHVGLLAHAIIRIYFLLHVPVRHESSAL